MRVRLWSAALGLVGVGVGRAGLRRAGLVSAGFLCASCASLSFEPIDASSGTFQSRGVAFTFLGRDFPQSALLLARANAADSELPNLMIREEFLFPYFWKLDFLLDIVSLRWASVSGTYGPAEDVE